ncbi:hypothetical protein SAMN05421764_1209 [Donghicola eburneus]|nr:hypothetical protein SAMN05421764_1209 [Donghicola eburneus]
MQYVTSFIERCAKWIYMSIGVAKWVKWIEFTQFDHAHSRFASVDMDLIYQIVFTVYVLSNLISKTGKKK